MPSVLSSRRGSIKTIPSVILLVAAAFAWASSAQAGTELTRTPVAQPRTGSEPAWSPLVNAAQEGAQEATQPRASSSVNPRKAVLLSLLLPGAGELYSGHKGRATGFFISEGAIWANFAAWEVAGHLRKNDYIEQARLNAGLGTESESDDYWRLVGTYMRSSGSGPDSYEDALRRDARNEFPGLGLDERLAPGVLYRDAAEFDARIQPREVLLRAGDPESSGQRHRHPSASPPRREGGAVGNRAGRDTTPHHDHRRRRGKGADPAPVLVARVPPYHGRGEEHPLRHP